MNARFVRGRRSVGGWERWWALLPWCLLGMSAAAIHPQAAAATGLPRRPCCVSWLAGLRDAGRGGRLVGGGSGRRKKNAHTGRGGHHGRLTYVYNKDLTITSQPRTVPPSLSAHPPADKIKIQAAPPPPEQCRYKQAPSGSGAHPALPNDAARTPPRPPAGDAAPASATSGPAGRAAAALRAWAAIRRLW